jgi:hypothetical protein
VNGAVHATDAVAGQAQTDLTTAYNDAAGRTPAAVLPGDLGGLFLTPGVFNRSSSLQLTGDVTLDAQGDPNAVFIFQVGSALTTASNSRVLLTNGAQSCNVFWQIGSSATLGTGTSFRGNILALQSITMNTSATLRGRALARNGAVTLDTNTIDRANCAAGTTPGGGGGTGGGGGGTTPGGGAGPNGTAIVTTTPRKIAQTVLRFGTGRCVGGNFRAVVTGLFIRRVTFLLDGKKVGSLSGKPPFEVKIRPLGGIHKLRAHVTFTDGTRARDISFRFRTCLQSTPSTPSTPRKPPFTG